MADHTVWEGDGHTFRIKSDDVPVLETPFAFLPTPPDTIVGKDPATGLPVYCRPPVVTITSPLPPIVVPDTGGGEMFDPCVRARCGAAIALRDKLVQDYDIWRNLINTAFSLSAGGAMTLILGEIRVLIVAMEETAVFMRIFDALKGILQGITPGLLTSLLPPLDQPATGQTSPPTELMLKLFFCTLSCTGGAVSFGASEQQAMTNAILLNPTYWNSDLEMSLLSEVMAYEPLEHWQTAMTAATPSALCDAMTCG